MKFQRASGILLHPTSLSGKYGIGTLGREAYNFVNFLVVAKQKLWQILPLGPTGYGDSPYQCFSAFAGNPLLIDLEKIVEEDGLLKKKDLDTGETFEDGRVDFGKVVPHKNLLLRKAYDNFMDKATELSRAKMESFCKRNMAWLDDFALFMSLKGRFKQSWNQWNKDIKFRNPDAVARYRKELADELEYHKFVQFIFFKQWFELKSYANSNGIKIIGDMPIFVAFDSSDAWSNPDIFFFDKERNPVKVAGVPPDYFSNTGQLWGNPLYNWEAMKSSGFTWWLQRIQSMAMMADIIRLDHFRGFSAYWSVPYGRKDAKVGEWEKAGGYDLFCTVRKELGDLPMLAEDLGYITPDVEKLREDFAFPGMNVLQFAFDPHGDSRHLPHNYDKNCIVYTGTHDNDTTLGWYEKQSGNEKKFTKEYMNSDCGNIAWDMIRLAWSSSAIMSITPMQDILSLGSHARMNEPGKTSGNWQWRHSAKNLTAQLKDRLKALTKTYRR
jgi:4-alpha-glucanotransferase